MTSKETTQRWNRLLVSEPECMAWKEATCKWLAIDETHKSCQRLPRARARSTSALARPPNSKPQLSKAGQRSLTQETFRSTYSLDFAGRQPVAAAATAPAAQPAAPASRASIRATASRRVRSNACGYLRPHPHITKMADSVVGR
mmetsp:Transcript_23811/g.38903  ORF Transcript_23811/g.38903 Transcript_23811/m.38903 type:complete len:144 (-) Transcript_23811:112-543(-)